MLAYYRGGSIIPRKERPRRASSLMRNDPYTLYVVLDSNVGIFYWTYFVFILNLFKEIRKRYFVHR